MSHAGAIAFLDAPAFGSQTLSVISRKNAVADHHPRAARLVMIQPNESAVAVFGVEIGPLVRKNVGVQVDLHGSSRRR